MFFKKKKPYYCDAKTIVKVFEVDIEYDTMIENLIFKYKGDTHKVGVNCYVNECKKRTNNGFYLDKQRFHTLEEFISNANLDGVLFVDLGIIEVMKSEEHGSPRNNGVLKQFEVDIEEISEYVRS